MKYYHYLTGADEKLERSIIEVLGFHYGRERAIGRTDLVLKLRRVGHNQIAERAVRESIKQLRRKGYLICSAAGDDGGYYMATNQREYVDFRQTEYAGKIADMSETMRAMDESAAASFGKFPQISQERLL